MPCVYVCHRICTSNLNLKVNVVRAIDLVVSYLHSNVFEDAYIHFD